MKDIFIIESLRTPFGSFGGTLADAPATELAATVIRAIMERNGLPPDSIDEVILGQVLQGGAAQAPARQAMRAAGLDDAVHAMTINKVCGSGMKAIMLGADTIRLGDADLVLAGGMENMSRAPYALPQARFGYRLGAGTMVDLMLHDALRDPYSGRHMAEITEAAILKNSVSRAEQDDYAARSYRLSRAARDSGRFEAELVPVTIETRKGSRTVAHDEEPGKGDPAKLPELKPVFSGDGSITAGNASTINDGAAVSLLASRAAVDRYGLTPKARLLAATTHSIHPDDFGEAPVGAIRKVLDKAALPLDAVDLFEINEAFAAVPLFAIRQLGLDIDRVNVNGGAVSIGHPVGASGARLVSTLVRELEASGRRIGLASLCIGGGEAVAVLLQRQGD